MDMDSANSTSNGTSFSHGNIIINAESDWNDRTIKNDILWWHIILIVTITILISCAFFYLLYLSCLWCFRLCGCADEEDEEDEIERIVTERLENRRMLRKRLEDKEAELVRKIAILEEKIKNSQQADANGNNQNEQSAA